MGINFDQIKDRAQDALTKNSGKIEQGLDKASGFAKQRFGKQSEKIDTATQKAKDFLHKNTGDKASGDGASGDGGSDGQSGGHQPPSSGDR